MTVASSHDARKLPKSYFQDRTHDLELNGATLQSLNCCRRPKKYFTLHQKHGTKRILMHTPICAKIHLCCLAVHFLIYKYPHLKAKCDSQINTGAALRERQIVKDKSNRLFVLFEDTQKNCPYICKRPRPKSLAQFIQRTAMQLPSLATFITNYYNEGLMEVQPFTLLPPNRY